MYVTPIRLDLLLIDCEKSLSFPSVFLAFLRASVELWSNEQRAAKPFPPRFFL